MRTIKKIAVISGSIAQYNLVDIFAKLLVDGFKETLDSECICDLIQYNDVNIAEGLFEQLSTCYDLIVTFNGLFINFNNAPLRDYLIKSNSLCLSFLIDHPYLHSKRLLNPVKRQVFSCIDRRHVDYMHRFYSNLKYTTFIPHGAILPGVPIKSWNEKDRDVAFFGSYVPPEQSLQIIRNSAAETQEVLIQIVEEIWNGNFNTLEEGMEYVLNLNGIHLPDTQLAEMIAESVYLDTYIRNERRALLINTLLDAGIEVNVYGKGWEDLETKSKDRLIINKPLDLQNCVNEMTRYKIVLNNMPLFADGSHERLFSIPAAGSLLITDSNPYVDEIYEEGIDYYRYSWNNIEALPELVTSILSDEMNAVNIIKNSREKVLNYHLWKNRAREILHYIEAINIQ